MTLAELLEMIETLKSDYDPSRVDILHVEGHEIDTVEVKPSPDGRIMVWIDF